MKKKQMLIIGIATILLLFIFLLHKQIVTILIVLILILVGSVSKIYKRFTRISLGFELITPITVLIAYSVNAGIAIIAAIIMLFLSMLIAGVFDFPTMLGEIGVYIILALLTTQLHAIDFVTVGIIMAIVRNGLLFPIGAFALGKEFVRLSIALGTALAFNIWIVLKFGSIFSQIL